MNGWSRRLIERLPDRLVLAFARPYVAGPSLDDALRRADELWEQRRLRSTLDVLGEQVSTVEAARRARDSYLRAADAVASRPYVSLSAKPSHLGHGVSPELAAEQFRALAERAAAHGTALTIDMEDTDLTDATLDLYRRLKPDFPLLGTVLQTRLFRTADDVESLAGLDARVRACIGAYDVPAALGHPRRREAKTALLQLLPRMLELFAVVELATHDAGVIAGARALVAEHPGRARVEYQMLLGVPRARLQDELLAAGHDVRLYVPYAESWDEALGYLRRRLAERPAMALPVLRNLAAHERPPRTARPGSRASSRAPTVRSNIAVAPSSRA